MKRAMLALTSMIIAGAANASGPTIVDACLRVAEHQLMVSLTPDNVQSFPDLDPPRVRMEVIGEADGALDLVATLLEKRSPTTELKTKSYGKVFCEFSSTTAPFGLSKFDCAGLSCFITDDRLEELQVLLQRDGF